MRNLSRVAGVKDGLPQLDDGTVVEAATVVWCTGFKQAFDWIDFPVFGDDGYPEEYRGVVESVPGLFFCGLSFQYAFSSMVLPRRRQGRGVRRPADRPAERCAVGRAALRSLTRETFSAGVTILRGRVVCDGCDRRPGPGPGGLRAA